jgi:pilus assembly protein CpaF
MKSTNYDLIKKIVEKTTDYCINGNQTLEGDAIREYILSCIEAEETIGYLSIKKKSQLVETIYNSINGLGPLQPLIDDDDITEIMINSEKEIFVEKNGQINKIDFQFESAERLRDLIQMIVSKVNRRVNESKPMVDARLADGSRVSILLPPIALKGPTMTIRKFPKEAMTMEKLIGYKSLDVSTAEVLRKLVLSKYNIFISGGTSSGKTSFLNALSNFIPKNERVITIEDSAELQLVTIENLVKLETREGNTEGRGEITMRDLIKSSLRMRPDRIIIGEVRGGEALEMLQAMNTGHDGSISTGHGNSIKDMLSRLETMVLTGTEMPMLAIKQQIASAIDIVIHLGRLRDQSRRVLAIAEIIGLNKHTYEINPLFTFVEDEVSTKENLVGGLVYSGNLVKNTDKLKLSAVDLKLGDQSDL